LGTPNPVDPIDEVPIRILKFKPMSTGSQNQQVSSIKKARPLAFDLIFNLNNQVIKTFKIEQSYRNALRQEYKAAGSTVMVEADDFDGTLDNDIYLTSPYDRVDIPKVSKLHNLRTNLLTNK
jgi:hypothetical protein